MIRHYALTPFALAALFASACAAPTDASPSDEITGSTNSAYTITSDFQWLPHRGGTGGNEDVYLRCPFNEVAIGIYGRAATYVDSLGLICAPLNADGTHGNGHPQDAYMGNGRFWPETEGNGNKFELRCAYDNVLGGLHGSSHTYLDRIGILCKQRPFTGAASPTSPFWESAGGTGGDWYVDSCPTGYAISGFNVRHGSWVDYQQALCVRVDP